MAFFGQRMNYSTCQTDNTCVTVVDQKGMTMGDIRFESAITGYINEVKMAYNDARLSVLIKQHGLDQPRPHENLTLNALYDEQQRVKESLVYLNKQIGETANPNLNSDLRLEHQRKSKLFQEIILRQNEQYNAEKFIGKIKSNLQPPADALKRATSLFRQPDHHSGDKTIRPQHDTNNPENKCNSDDNPYKIFISAHNNEMNDPLIPNTELHYKSDSGYIDYDGTNNGKTIYIKSLADKMIDVRNAVANEQPKKDNDHTTKTGGTHIETHTQEKHPRKKQASFN